MYAKIAQGKVCYKCKQDGVSNDILWASNYVLLSIKPVTVRLLSSALVLLQS